MKSILDPTFKYVDSNHTNLRKTFERIREEQKENQPPPVPTNVIPIFERKPA